MSLCPSNMISEQITGHKPFQNLARHVDVWSNAKNDYETIPDAQQIFDEIDSVVTSELQQAGIVAKGGEWARWCSNGTHREVPTKYVGTLHGWRFRRAWYYWVAEGPGIPANAAMELHTIHGGSVRVDGDCSCPSPLERFHGSAVGHYHVDNQEGLNALADLIRSIYVDASSI